LQRRYINTPNKKAVKIVPKTAKTRIVPKLLKKSVLFSEKPASNMMGGMSTKKNISGLNKTVSINCFSASIKVKKIPMQRPSTIDPALRGRRGAFEMKTMRKMHKIAAITKTDVPPATEAHLSRNCSSSAQLE
jgi:hypothetical protein